MNFDTMNPKPSEPINLQARPTEIVTGKDGKLLPADFARAQFDARVQETSTNAVYSQEQLTAQLNQKLQEGS